MKDRMTIWVVANRVPALEAGTLGEDLKIEAPNMPAISARDARI